MSALEQALDLIGEELWLVFIVFLRIGPALAVAPGFGHKAVPVRIRLVCALLLALVIAPSVRPVFEGPPPEPESLLYIVTFEALLGLGIGILARLVVLALEKAGSMIGQVASLSQMFPGGADQLPVFGHIMSVTALAIFFSTPLFEAFLMTLAMTYQVFAIGDPQVSLDFGDAVSRKLDEVTGLAYSLASPFVGAVIVYHFFIGAANKAMPQLMVSFIGIPFVSLMAIFLFYETIEHILLAWYEFAINEVMNPLAGQ